MFEKGLPSMRASSGKLNFLGSVEHREVARDAVRKSLVLLKNDGVLPIRQGQHILVAGDGGDNIGKQSGGWTITWQGKTNSNEDFPGATSIYEGIKNAIESTGGSAEFSESAEWKKEPDVAVVVFGEEPYAEGQGAIAYLENKTIVSI